MSSHNSNHTEMIKVILLIDCASEFDRKLLRGMVRYSKENGPWLFYRIPSDSSLGKSREEWVVEWAKKWKADAIIGRWDETKSDLLQSLNIPIVLQNNRSRSDVYSNLTGDYEGAGRMAARYFKKKLFTNYAFFGVREVIWSEEREKGFRDEIHLENCSFFSYKEAPVAGDDRGKVIEWLKSLPRRTALFCCDDAHALLVTEACRMAGIRIPEDIAVMGVDDDDLLCEISDPPISSVQLEVEQGGYMTCKLLHQQILKKNKKPFNVEIGSLGIKERNSTQVYNVADNQVLKLLNYVDEHYSEDVKMDDILKNVPLSRRSIEMRFKKETGMTIYQYLLSVRVEHLAYLLSTTVRPFVEIAYEVGFHDFGNVSRTFRKFKGCTPIEYRRRYCVI